MKHCAPVWRKLLHAFFVVKISQLLQIILRNGNFQALAVRFACRIELFERLFGLPED